MENENEIREIIRAWLSFQAGEATKEDRLVLMDLCADQDRECIPNRRAFLEMLECVEVTEDDFHKIEDEWQRERARARVAAHNPIDFD